MTEQRTAAALLPAPSVIDGLPVVDPQQLAQACTVWQSGRDGGSTLLRAAARALVGEPHYFSAHYIADKEKEARADPTVLAKAATLLRAVNRAEALTANQWNIEAGYPQAGFAGRGLKRKMPEDEEILAQLKSGHLNMPLWGRLARPGHRAVVRRGRSPLDPGNHQRLSRRRGVE
jgi:hypothetical protein